MDGLFFYHMLERYKPEPEGYKRHFTILMERNCLYPNKEEEQLLISSFLKNIDILITLHQRKCEKLKKVKSAMLERMFV